MRSKQNLCSGNKTVLSKVRNILLVSETQNSVRNLSSFPHRQPGKRFRSHQCFLVQSVINIVRAVKPSKRQSRSRRAETRAAKIMQCPNKVILFQQRKIKRKGGCLDRKNSNNNKTKARGSDTKSTTTTTTLNQASFPGSLLLFPTRKDEERVCIEVPSTQQNHFFLTDK